MSEQRLSSSLREQRTYIEEEEEGKEHIQKPRRCFFLCVSSSLRMWAYKSGHQASDTTSCSMCKRGILEEMLVRNATQKPRNEEMSKIVLYIYAFIYAFREKQFISRPLCGRELYIAFCISLVLTINIGGDGG